MLLGKVFEPFLEKRPVCVMARAVLERLFDADRLDGLFERTANRGYTRQLLFSSLVRLMGDVVTGVRPSVHAAFQAAEDDWPVSLTALYNKLDRVETQVSAELVRDSAASAGAVIEALSARLNPWLPGFRCRVLDGNHLSATEHRLEELRTTWSAPLPGRALVVLDQERMLAERVVLTEDGHAQERSLIDEILGLVAENDLWIADRNFSTLKFLAGIHRRGAFFVVRQHGQLKGRLTGRRRRAGRCPTGAAYEQAVEVTDPQTKEMLLLRRITVELEQPTRDGDRELHVLTNVAATDADALQLAELYGQRWTIETVFHEIAQTLECEIQTLGYPKAALFAFCLALVVFNAVSLLKASLRAVHGAETVQAEVSGYYLSLEIRGTYEGMLVAVPERRWKVFRTLTVKQFATTLKQLARRVTLRRYRKHPRAPKKPPPKKSAYANGGHVSTFRLLQKRKPSC